MCSWNNHYCWPGKCGEELTKDCTCAQDFKIIQQNGETSCQPKKLPSILTCGTVVVGPNMEKKQARSSTNSTECQYLTDMYGNFQPSYFKFDLAAEYTIDIKGYTKQDFISETKFGITDFGTNVVKILVNGKTFFQNKNLLFFAIWMCLFNIVLYLRFPLKQIHVLHFTSQCFRIFIKVNNVTIFIICGFTNIVKLLCSKIFIY
jgi:hypothetical protein